MPTLIHRLPDLKYLQELFYIESPNILKLHEESGLKRRVYRGGQRANTWAGSVSKMTTGGTYWRVGVDSKLFMVSRIIFFLATEVDPYPYEIDHIDINSLNNTVSNLRLCEDRRINTENKGIPKNNTSGEKGIYWDKEKNKYRSMVFLDKKRVHLGYFEKYEDACRERIRYFETFPRS